MSSFSGVWASLLAGAITAGRATLRDLEPPEVPSSLQRVAAYQGGSLPPPLAARLLAEIDNNDWLRDKVLESWDGEPSDPSRLFLERPKGWWVDLADAGGAASGGREQARLDELAKKLRRAETKLGAAFEKAADYKKALADEKRRGKEKAESVRRAAEARFAAESAESAENRARVVATQQRLQLLEQEHQELAEAFNTLRARLARARRSRLEGPVAQGGSLSMPSDPVKLGRLLDLQTASFGRNPGAAVVPDQDKADPLTLDPGVRPDSSDAIRWLLNLDEAVVVVVDGYNAQFHIDRGDFTSGAARRKLIDALKRLRTSATIKHRVVVVYDSTLPGERVARSSVAGVEIRFAEKERIADEEIVEMADSLDRVVVISSDREVREGSDDTGAVVLWSEALAAWLERL